MNRFLLIVLKKTNCFSLMALFFTATLLMGIQNCAQAQSTTDKYYFETGDDGSLAEDLYGNAVNMSSGTTSLISANQNDTRTNMTSIGFTFSFLGSNMTYFSASSNGALRLGTSNNNSNRISATSYGDNFPLSSQNIIAPYWGDLKTRNSSGKVHYKVQGSSGKRVFIIEFLNMGINYNSSGADGTYQCRLYEETGIIEFVYGNMSVGSTSGSNSKKVAVIGFSKTTGNNNHFSVNQANYNYSTTSVIKNNNSSTGTITGLNSSSDGNRRWFRFYPNAFVSDIISITYGSSNWCVGETRDITVRIKNVGTHAWTDDASVSRDINIGLKWTEDSDYGSGPTFITRLDAEGLEPGDTKDYVFYNVPTTKTSGTSKLRSDIVYEQVSWFASNNSFVGPGNNYSETPNITIRPAAGAVTASGGGTFCNSTTISASGGGGGTTIYFQDNISNGTSMSNGGTPQTITASGTYYFRARTNTYGCWGPEDNVSVTINPNIPVSVTATSDISSACAGSTFNFTANPTNEGASPQYQWYVNNVAVTGETNPTYSPSNLNNNDQVTVELTSSVTPCATNNPATSNAIPVTIGAIPATPGAISGITDACPYTDTNVPTSYSISPVGGAVSYNWTVPVGVSISSGQGTTSLSVTFDNSFALTHSKFKVSATNSFPCTSAESELEVVKIVPGIPVAISGPVNACEYAGALTNATYSIASVPNATGYTWTLPNNATLVSGQGTTSIDVSYAGAFTSGSIKVTADANCGSRAPRSLTIRKTGAAAPGNISGPTNACPYLGNFTNVTYSIDPVDNATSYDWVLPNNMVLISGQGTTSITVNFNSNFTTGQLRVRSVSNCNNSGYRNLVISNANYGAPGPISGTQDACPLIDQMTTTLYSINKVANAPSYNWVVPTGVTIVSHPAGAGVNDTIIEVSFTNSFVSGSEIKVQATGCVNTAYSTLKVFSAAVPPVPSMMSGPTNVCEYMISPTNISGTAVTYWVPKRDGALSYNWTAPAKATIVNHPEGPGINDTIVEVIFDDDYADGYMEVTASNGCSSSAARTLRVKVLKPSAPGAITPMQTQSCPGREFTYSIAAMPANATSIEWDVPSGATILSGQGSTSISVSYPDTQVSGVVSATAVANCAVSSTRKLTVKLADCSGPKTMYTFSNPVSESELLVFPNPSNGNFNIRINSQESGKVQVRILDITGREVNRIIAADYAAISTGSTLQPGIYFVEVTQNGKRMVQKIVKY